MTCKGQATHERIRRNFYAVTFNAEFFFQATYERMNLLNSSPRQHVRSRAPHSDITLWGHGSLTVWGHCEVTVSSQWCHSDITLWVSRESHSVMSLWDHNMSHSLHEFILGLYTYMGTLCTKSMSISVRDFWLVEEWRNKIKTYLSLNVDLFLTNIGSRAWLLW